jgi:hypothetical protein
MMIRRAFTLAGAAALVALLGGGATTATAAPCDGGFFGGGPLSAWELDNDGEFNDADLFPSVGADPFREDAFDDYSEVEINGDDYDNPNTDGCRYPRNNREVVFPTDVVNGIAVRPQLYVSGRAALGRLFVSLRNTTAGPLTVEFAWDGNLGAGDPVVGATSSGDQSMNQDDRWGTSCDDEDLDGCSNVAGETERDPELSFNWEGKGSKKHSADIVEDPELTDDDVRFQFDDVTIGAGKTVTFLNVTTLAPKIRAANKAARAIDRNPKEAGVFAKLSKKELKRLQNWKKPKRRRN